MKHARQRVRVPDALVKIDKISKNKALLKELSKADLELYKEYQKAVRESTEDKWTDVEYEQIALDLLFLHKFDRWAQRREVEEIPINYANLARMIRGRLMDKLERDRTSIRKEGSFLSEVKDFVLEAERTDGGTLKIEYKKEIEDE